MVVPTGLGAEIGGHAGDATAAARLLAEACEFLIVHPNVVNASDICEITDNMLYVEGSTLDLFLAGSIGLRRVRSNRILVAVNAPVGAEQINAVSAARVTLGLDVSIVELNTPLILNASLDEAGRAGGTVDGWKELLEQVSSYDFDALAIVTRIGVDKEVAWRYLQTGGTNPWGGVEAIATKLIGGALGKPVAHAPVDSGIFDEFNEVVDPRMAAELVSVAYMHCVLKGLHKAPRIGGSLYRSEIDFLVTADNCWGPPHEACRSDPMIPIIVVRENHTVGSHHIPPQPGVVIVDNYVEAAGCLLAMRAGISLASVRRPLQETVVHNSVGRV